MSTQGEKLILRLLSQSVERVNKTCNLDTHFDRHDFNDGNPNINSNDKVDEGRESNFSGALKCSNTEEKSDGLTKQINNKKVDSKHKVQLENKSLDIGTTSEKKENRKCRRPTKNVKRNFFTREEVNILLKAMKKYGDKLNHKEIANQLGRNKQVVVTKIRNLKEGGSGPRKDFTIIEDKMIMDAYFKKLASGQNFRFMGNISKSDLLQLSLNIQRGHTVVCGRWKRQLQPWILQYFSGTLNLEIVPMLVNFLTANYSGVNSIDWSGVVCKPEFSGHTESSLRYLLHSTMDNSRKKYKIDEVDLSSVKEYTDQMLKEGKFRKISNRTETRQMEVVKYFQEYLQKSNITDVFDQTLPS